jgi:hypothetical protein
MNTKKFRELCQEVLVPLLTDALERPLIDIHDMIDISSNELMRSRAADICDNGHVALYEYLPPTQV